MHRLLLAANRRRTRIQAGITLAVRFLDSLKHGLVVQLRVPVMHRKLRRTVIPHHVAWNTLTEISLDGIYTLAQQLLNLALESIRGLPDS